MCLIELSNFISSRIEYFRCQILRNRFLRSLPRHYIRPYCFILRRVLGGFGLFVTLSSIFGGIWYQSLQKQNLQVFGVVLCFQLMVIGWASGLLRLLTWFFEDLHANMIVHLITAMYMIQASYLVLSLDDTQPVLRASITYTVTTLFVVYVVKQLPLWKVKLVLGSLYWSSIGQLTFIIGALSFLIHFLLQNPCFCKKFKMSESFLICVDTEFEKTDDLSLNWIIFKDPWTIGRVIILFGFQAIAYHVAIQEELARDRRPVRMNRRFG